MTLHRFAPAALAAILFAGCQNDPENYIPPPESAPAAEANSSSTAELLDRNVATGDLTVGRAKDPAKTVGYAEGSTAPGEKLLDGTLIVDQVARQDADNHFGVTVTVFNNRDDGAATFEWRIVFLASNGAEVGSLHSGWKARSVEAKHWVTLSNSATVRGAVKFRLEARPRSAEPAPEQPAPSTP
jgi:hypothetical protein